MDRDRSTATAGAGAATRLNARPSSQLFVKQDGRKPLFASATASNATAVPPTTNHNNNIHSNNNSHNHNSGLAKPRAGLFSRRTNSESATTPAVRRDSSSSAGSATSTRIPRPSSARPSGKLSFPSRKALSIVEAWELAGDEDVTDGEPPGNGSPSPAPRPWRANPPSDEAKMRRLLSEDHLDTKKPILRRPGTSSEQEPHNARNGITPSKRSETPRHDERNATVDTISREPLADWKSRTRLSLGPPPSRDPTRDLGSEANLPALVPGIEDVPFPSIERAAQPQEAPMSPEKSFAWQIDQDFTAGDLSVSDSPRIRFGFGYQPHLGQSVLSSGRTPAKGISPLRTSTLSRNTKLDEIRAREAEVGISTTPYTRQRNTKLDEIRAREQLAESQIPIPDRSLPRPKNTKLDEIRQREVDGLPKRTLAALRLEEIRERNSMSRSLSPEDEPRPKSSRGPIAETSSFEPRPAPLTRPKSAFEIGGERVPDTPVTIFKGPQSKDNAAKEPRQENGGKDLAKESTTKEANTGKGDEKLADSRDLLRRLARATSASPAPEPEPEAPKPSLPPKVDKADADGGGWRSRRARRLSEARKANKVEAQQAETSKPEGLKTEIPKAENPKPDAPKQEIAKPESVRPTVEFAGLRRVRSTESTKDKRSSMHSEGDPVDRIDSEMKLFAPAENHSERGSVRAPSPKSDEDRAQVGADDEVDATPKPKKQDVLSMPTPKVTGAYVETPATVRVEDKFAAAREKDEPKPKVIEKPQTVEKPQISTDTTTALRERRRPAARRTRVSDTASDPGSEDKDAAISTSAAVRKPRARSLPRRRPLLKNTAKPHSVRDDMLELQRIHNIDDSTLEDLEGLLFGRHKASIEELADFLTSASESEATDHYEPQIDSPPAAEAHHGSINPTTYIKKEPLKSELSDGELAAYDRMTKSLRTGLLGIRSAKKGIARLEDQVSHTNAHAQNEKKPQLSDQNDSKTSCPHRNNGNKSAEGMAQSQEHGECPVCAAAGRQRSQHAWPRISIPVPSLYHRTPHFRFTVLGLLTLLLTLWLTAESTMCALYCRPTYCTPTDPCVYALDDPTFGAALPVKLDQWTTGGRGRVAASVLWEEAQCRVADVLDELLGRDPTHPDYARDMSFAQRRRHRRRLREKGLLAPRAQPNREETAKWAAWGKAMKANERAREAREMGYVVDEENETMGADQRVG